MSYSAISQEENRIVLQQGWRVRLAVPILMITALGTSIAAGISVGGGLYPPQAFMLAGVSLLLLFGGLLYARGRSLRPRAFEFQNDAGDFQILEQDGRRSTIPYGRIKSFLIRRKSRGRWTVFMFLGDGAYWDLAEFALRRTATAFQGRLARGVRLRTRDTRELQPLAENVHIQESGDKTEVSWRENVSFQTSLAASGLVPGILLVIAGLVMQARPDLLRAYWTWCVGGMAALQLILMALAFRLRGTEHKIIVDGERIGDGSRFMAGSDVHRVQYSFDPDQGVPKILLLNQEQAERLDRMRVGDVRIREIPRMYWMERRLFKLPLLGLLASDAEALRARLAELLDHRPVAKKKR